MKVVIVSGFFNPLHGGHLDMIEAASRLGDRLVVIVKNDHQQVLKKGRVILGEDNRQRLLSALRVVDEVRVAVDDDWSVSKTLVRVTSDYPNDDLIFVNGGDNNAESTTPEVAVCRAYGIKLVYGVGGARKTDSSTRINQALGYAR